MLRWIGLIALAVGFAGPAVADDWDDITERARGQTVYFNAWGGDDQINGYIAWVGEQVEARYGVMLQHVKLGDTAEAVGRVIAEKAAGRDEGGSIDLIWINGENFKAMKDQELLFGPFAGNLPNAALIDSKGKPTTLVDFTIPTDGFESPWGMAQFVMIYDSARVPSPPRSITELGQWIVAHPGRFTYPAPPDYIGTTLLKHVVAELTPDEAALQQPTSDATITAVIEAPFSWLDDMRPSMWRQGRSYPASAPALHQLLDDGEVDFSFAFNPAEASRAISAGRLPDTVRTAIFTGGTIGNTHFVAIPFNAAHADGAQIVANFLLSPEAQARKQATEFWGDGTVLGMAALTPAQRALFDDLPRGIATLPPDELTPVRLEPHPSWTSKIEAVWLQRFGS